jgi:hypothetical protein
MTTANGFCQRCGQRIEGNGRRRRPARYCCDACQQATYRQEHAQRQSGGGAGTSENIGQKLPWEAIVSPATGEYRNGPYPDTLNEPENSPGDGGAFFGWVLDGRDVGGSLAAAVRCFRDKPTWGGALPDVVRACPVLANNGLGPVAAGLGLAVVPDKRIQPGLIYLGVGDGQQRNG